MKQIQEQNYKNLTRQGRGLLIANNGKIIETTKGYLVPSQSNQGKYIVTIKRNKHKCNCKDYESRQCKCKHIWAVEYSITKQTEDYSITQTVRKTYPQNWKSYNLAQQNEKDLLMRFLSDITNRIPNQTYDFGRPKTALSDAIFAMVFKVYSGFSGRRFATDLATARDKGFIEKAIPYNTMFDYFNNEELTYMLSQLVKISSIPLIPVEKDFAIDSTGFGTLNFQRWYSHKYGKEVNSRKWVKCHFVTGVKSNIITSVKITTENNNDCPEFKPLVKDTAKFFNMEEISADKAYLSKDNFNLCKELGVTPFIPFKSNSTGKARGSYTWSKMYHYFMLNREDFLEHYHKRSNVESSVQMLKSKFGNRVRSKNWTAQVNEVLCKVIAHNICVVIQELHELGISNNFYLEDR